MRAYLVGGAVRDRLLGLPHSDNDWLVTGVSEAQLEAAGYRRVGQDFPVFLHPVTAEEYALPRGASRELEEAQAQVEADLLQRDLTINAIAQDPDGHYIDPLGGRDDLQARRLRHTPAFAQDPLRVLRLARLATRLLPFGFRIADETADQVAGMVATGDLDQLVPERVWAEILQALQADTPQHFFRTLQQLGALRPVLPELARLFGVPQPAAHHPEIDTGIHSLMVLEMAARLTPDPAVRFAALMHDLGKGTTPRDRWPSHHGHEQRGARLVQKRCSALRTPNRFRQLASQVAEYHTHCHRALELKPGTLLKLLMALGAVNQPRRLEPFLIACEADARGRKGFAESPYPQADYLRSACRAACQVDSATLAASAESGEDIARILFQARSRAIAACRTSLTG
ncbi:MAG: multifunctional CCA addition/repair protein [Sedimenticola sp.]|nr:multifunctional CCA addition/repair protein [Sedimenticola sp.]